MTYVPKPLFDKNSMPKQEPKNERPAEKKFVPGTFVPGQATVATKKFDNPEERENKPTHHVGAFKPPVMPVKSQEVKAAGPTSPKPVFNTNGISEFDISPADRLKYPEFQPIDIKKIKDHFNSISLTDRISAIQYGQEINDKLARSVDSLLEFVRNNVTSGFNADTRRLQEAINFDFFKPRQEESFFGVFKKEKTLQQRVNEAIDEVDNIARSLKFNISNFLNIIPKIEEPLDESKKYHRDLLILVKAGKEKIADFNHRKLIKIEEKLKSQNVMEVQNARDALDIFNIFVKRIETLDLSVGQNELTIAQIRMTQSTNVKVVETLNNITSNLIPMWKQGMASAISSNSFDKVIASKDLLSKSICDIMSPSQQVA